MLFFQQQNSSNYDWLLVCKTTGDLFSGPKNLSVKAHETSYYPLTFHPTSECCANGHLVINNRLENHRGASNFAL